MKKTKDLQLPEISMLEQELNRVKQKSRFRRTLGSTVYALLIVAAVAVLIATLIFPVLQIYGTSMTPTLTEGNIVVAVKNADFKRGDIIAFYYNNKILVKRVIAMPGEWVNIDTEGNVYINDVLLDEPYIDAKAFGECDITLPYQVPDNRIFVMGDHRDVSVDSRSTTVGCVSDEQVVGRLALRVWPFKEVGALE